MVQRSCTMIPILHPCLWKLQVIKVSELRGCLHFWLCSSYQTYQQQFVGLSPVCVISEPYHTYIYWLHFFLSWLVLSGSWYIRYQLKLKYIFSPVITPYFHRMALKCIFLSQTGLVPSFLWFLVKYWVAIWFWLVIINTFTSTHNNNCFLL